VAAALAGIALTLAFPKFNAEWLAPLGAALLFWSWRKASWKRAFLLGWFAGTIFFALTSSWMTYTVGADVGPFAPLIVLVPSLYEGLFFALAGAATAVACARAPRALAPLACAAAFTAFEWLRSIGPFGAPFMQIGYSQAGGFVAVFAAYAGTYGVTFVTVAIGAYLADAIARGTARSAIVAYFVVALAFGACWLAWPARHAPPATMRVAVVQGNITQSLKWAPGSVSTGIDRYVTMTNGVMAFHPQLIVWPETVVAEFLNEDPASMLRFAMLARKARSTLVVGAQELRDRRLYNALYVFTDTGSLEGVYEKRQLLPFAESFPAKDALGWLPYVKELGGIFSSGSVDAVYDSAPLRFGPLICWESAFADLTNAQVRRGAQILVVSTDDAWFGTTAGPYMHAQIAQLRAIENGMWVVRAASTGVSGIIAPDGTYVTSTQLGTRTVVTGMVGPPAGSFFSRIGPTPVALALIVLYALSVARKRRVE
jgi:apolipoprotein N-acyltransferase